ncbi:hypothetical protein [Klebsiella phage 05F01]|nr:hypothetical protein [Klebsiella phage 05F01]
MNHKFRASGIFKETCLVPSKSFRDATVTHLFKALQEFLRGFLFYVKKFNLIYLLINDNINIRDIIH